MDQAVQVVQAVQVAEPLVFRALVQADSRAGLVVRAGYHQRHQRLRADGRMEASDTVVSVELALAEKNKDPSPAAKRRDLSPQERGVVLLVFLFCSTEYCALEKRQYNLAPLLRGEVAAKRRVRGLLFPYFSSSNVLFKIGYERQSL
jgi:hypothetical protein